MLSTFHEEVNKNSQLYKVRIHVGKKKHSVRLPIIYSTRKH